MTILVANGHSVSSIGFGDAMTQHERLTFADYAWSGVAPAWTVDGIIVHGRKRFVDHSSGVYINTPCVR